MAAKTEEEQIRVDLIEAEAEDMRTKWSTLCYHDDFVSNLNIFNIDV
jgi:glutathione S-transferase